MKKTVFSILSLALVAMFILSSCDETEDPKPAVIENLNKGVMNGTLESDYTLDAATQYQLTGSFIIAEGAKLTIPAGTKIEADALGTSVYIAVMMGAQIDIQGTAAAPVVMSSTNGNPEDWGGLTLCGKGISTAGVNAEAEVGGFIYGGTDNADNSGSIKYLVIKGTGAEINIESQYNGISFYAVGSGTTVENVAVINGADDGVEFFGGAVSVTNLYLENNEDDAIDWTEGWSGGVENSYISHTIADFSTVVEADKENENPVLTNLTAVSTTGGTALQFKKESGATITGLYISGYDVELDMKDGGALSNVQIDGANADATLITDETSKYSLNSGVKSAVTVDISGWSWISADL